MNPNNLVSVCTVICQRAHKWSPVIFGPFLLLLAAVNSFAQQNGCGTNPVQDWYWIDYQNRPLVTVRGIISQIHLNTGGFFDDGDWNIHVTPDENWVLRNSSGTYNSNGRIELEIQTGGNPDDLAQLFSVGTRIESSGEWCEDLGHDSKTELHPLYWMRTVNTNPAVVFVGQDNSGRFIDAENLRWESFSFDLPGSYPIVRPGAIPPSATQIVHESSRISRGTTSSGITPNGYGIAVYLDSWWFSNCENVGVVSYGDSPYYLGTIARSTAPLLRETVTYQVGTEIGTGQKIAFIKVEAELDSPPQGNLVYSKWEYESSAGTIIGTVDEVRNQPPHRFVLSMPYAPALGYYQHTWKLSVSGATVPLGMRLPQSSPDFTQTVERTHVTEGRVYALDESSISLTRTGKGGVCPEAVYLTIDQSRLLPQINLRGVRWFVRILKDADGYSVTNPSEVFVTTQNPLNDAGFTAQTYNATVNDPAMDKRLDVIWKQLSSGQPNLTELIVIARGVTELGEQVEAREFLSAVCGIAPFSFSQILEYSYRYMSQKGMPGEMYEAIRNARGKDKLWLDALGRFAKGEKITESERSTILSRAMDGSKLPAIQRKKELKRILTTQRPSAPVPMIIPLKMEK